MKGEYYFEKRSGETIKRAEKLLPKEFVEKLMDESFTIEQLNHYSAGCFGSKTARKYLMTGMLLPGCIFSQACICDNRRLAADT